MPNTASNSLTPVFRRRGFTLMEVVFVLALTGIIMGMGVPRYMRSVNRYRANSAARRIAADLAYAQSQARTTGASQTFVFSLSGKSYQMANMKNLSGKTGTYSVDLSAEPYRISTLDVDWSGSKTITFDAYGQPSQSGNISVVAGDTTSVVRLGPPADLAASDTGSTTTTSSGGITIQLGGLSIHVGL